ANLLGDRPPRARLGPPDPPPARLNNAHALTRRQLVAPLSMHRKSIDGVRSQRSITTAKEPTRRKHGPVAHAERDQRMTGIIAQDHLLAEPAAPAPRTARIGDEALALDRRVRECLPHLDR